MSYRVVSMPQYANVKAWIDRLHRTIYINTSARETANLFQIIR